MNENGNAKWGLIFALVYPALFYIPYIFDGTTSILPSYQDESQWLLYYDFIARSFSEGYFPLWTPDLYCGMPFLAWSHSAALYPSSVIFSFLDFVTAAWANQWIHAAVYSSGVYLLCRRAGARVPASIAATTAAVPLFLLTNLGHFLPNIRTGVWIPLLFLSIVELTTRRSVKWLFFFILINFLMYLGGQVELIGLAYEAAAVALIVAGIVFWRYRGKILSAYALVGVGFALGFLASQVQSLPTLELTHYSVRGQGLTYEYFKIWSNRHVNLVFWLPYLVSGLGVTAIVAALSTLKKSAAVMIASITLVYCAALVHDLFGIMWVLYQVPVLKGLLAHSRILFIGEIILQVIIALGVQKILDDRRLSWRIGLAGALTLAAIVWWLAVIPRLGDIIKIGEPNSRGPAEKILVTMGYCLPLAALIGFSAPWWERISRRLPVFPSAAVVLIFGLTYAVPLWVGMPHNPSDPFKHSSDYVQFMKNHRGLHRVQTIYSWENWEDVSVPLQSGILYGTRSADGFITVSLDRYTRLMDLIAPGTLEEKNGKINDLEATRSFKEGDFISASAVPLINLLGMRYLVAEKRNLKFADHFFLYYPDSPLLMDTSGGKPSEDETRVGIEGFASFPLSINRGDLLEGGLFVKEQPAFIIISSHPENETKTRRLLYARYLRKESDADLLANLSKVEGHATISIAAIGGNGPSNIIFIRPTIINNDKFLRRLPVGQDFSVFENSQALSPAFIPTNASAMTKSEALEYMGSPDFSPEREAVYEGKAVHGLRFAPLKKGEGAKTNYSSSERIEIVVIASVTRLVVLTECYFPGWRAWVDGREEIIRPADYAFRGVEVRPGLHKIQMAYEPASFRIGLWISIGSLFFLVTAILLYGLRRRYILLSERAEPHPAKGNAVSLENDRKVPVS